MGETTCGGVGSEACLLGGSIDDIPYILVVTDREGRYLRVNRVARETFGFDPVGMLRQEVAAKLDARLADGSPMTPQVMPSTIALNGGAADNFEYTILDAQGCRRWLLVSAVPIGGGGGGVLIINKDITLRKEMESASRRNEERLRLLSDTASLLLSASDPMEVVSQICESVMEHLDCNAFISFKADEARKSLSLLAFGGVPEEVAATFRTLDYGVAVCGCVARDRTRIVAESIQEGADPRAALVGSMGMRAYCCHPLMSKGEALLGTLSFGTRSRDRFSPEELGFMKAISDLVAVALQRDTERRELERSEARSKLFIEHAPAAIAMLDNDLRCLMVSRCWREDFGLGELAVEGLPPSGILPGLPPHLEEAFVAALTGTVREAEAERFTLPGGAKLRLSWEVRPWYGPSGRIGGVAIFTEDVTRQTKDREALAASERRYRAIGESIDYGVWVCDPEGRNTYASESFLKLVGITQEECSNFGWGKLLHPDEEKATIQAWKECVATGGLWNREHRFRDVTGQWRDVLARGVQVRDEEGRVLGWAGINLDISELKHAERQLESTLTHLNFHMENTPLAVVEWDSSFCVVRWAGAAESIFGWSAEEVLGRQMMELNLIHEDDLDKVTLLAEAMVAGRRPSNVNASRNYRKDGRVIHCEWYNSAKMGEDGALDSVLSLVLDVTERNRLVEETREAKDAAEAANRAKSLFLARMSHELRTPLNGVNGMIDLALREGLSQKAQGFLGLARRSSKGLLEIINDLLDLSSIEAGKVELANAPFNPRALLGYLREIHAPSLRGEGVKLLLEVDPRTPDVVIGDETHLRQVLTNLLGNALKFTSRGRIELKVAPSEKAAAPGRLRLAFTVADTGIGIQPKYLPLVFESFSPATRETHAQYGGTGLGLSISRQLVNLMGGEISVESRFGEGSTFSFTVEVEEAPQTAAMLPGPDSPLPPKPARKLRILLAEDNTTSRLFAQAVIEGQGHAVTGVPDGAQALRLLAKERFDLILTDIQMPLMDGLELTRAVRAGEAGACPADVPIVAMTAHAFAEDRRRFISAGINDCITKPVELLELDRVLARWSGRIGLKADAQGDCSPDRLYGRAERRLDELLERLPQAKVWELVDLAVSQLEPALASLANRAAAGEARELAEEAHRLRGTWTVVLGSDRMLELSLMLERNALGGDLEGALETVSELRSEVAAVVEMLAERRAASGF